MKDDVMTKIKKSSLRWFGHVERMMNERLTKQVYMAEVKGNDGRRQPSSYKKKRNKFVRIIDINKKRKIWYVLTTHVKKWSPLTSDSMCLVFYQERFVHLYNTQ